MKIRFLGFLLVVLILAVSCQSKPETKTAQPAGPAGPVVSTTATTPAATQPAAPAAQGTYRVTQQEYDSTMGEVQAFINELNKIISSRDYRAWRSRLSAAYLAEISSAEFLAQVSESPAMKTRRIRLGSAEEYFIHVVVPSRANSRVDSIEFVSRNRVIAYTVNTNRAGEDVRLRLYDLEKVNNSWIIIN